MKNGSVSHNTMIKLNIDQSWCARTWAGNGGGKGHQGETISGCSTSISPYGVVITKTGNFALPASPL